MLRPHRLLVALTTAAVVLVTPASALAVDAAQQQEESAPTPPPPAGSCVHPFLEDGPHVRYRWTTRTNLWRSRPVATGIVARRSPSVRGARVGALSTTTEHSRQSVWYLVLDARQVGDTCWLNVRMPAFPNDRAGWVSRDELVVERSYWQIEVDLSDRRVRAYNRGRLRLNARVVIGSKRTPTPRSGAAKPYAIYDVVRGRANAFTGSWQLATTALSPQNPKIGRIGLHGRGGASLAAPLGTAASNGCVRMANADVSRLVKLVGTSSLFGIPVTVTT